MSEREEQENDVQTDVEGVDTDPGGNKAMAVDTNERLEGKDEEPDFDDIPEEDLEKERDERLDPDNRPENSEVVNSQRDFNPETGLFEDSDIEPPEGAPFATTEAEQSNSSSSDSSDDSDSADDSDGSDASDDSGTAGAEPKDRQEATDAEQSKEASESKDTEG